MSKGILFIFLLYISFMCVQHLESGDGRPGGWTSTGMPKADRSDSIDTKAEKSRTLDWLEMAADKAAQRKLAVTSSGGKSFDSTQDDGDWLGTKTQQSTAVEKTSDFAADYLGLGTEIDLTSKPLRFHTFFVSYHLFYMFFFCLVLLFMGFSLYSCLLYTSPSPRDRQKSRMPSSA